MTTTGSTVIPRASAPKLGVAALVLAIATPILAVVGWVWAESLPGMEGLGVAVMALFAVGAVALAAVVVGLISLAVSKPNSLAKVSLLLVAATAIVLLLLFLPPAG